MRKWRFPLLACSRSGALSNWNIRTKYARTILPFATARPRPSLGAPPHSRCNAANSARDEPPARAFVVHAGEDRYPISESVEAIGLREMIALLSGTTTTERS